MRDVSVRPRRDEDVPAVVELLLRQQSRTRYPFRDPLPFPAEQFVVRRGELASWVAVVGGHPAGHVSAVRAREDDLGRRWSQAVGRPVAELGAISVLVVDHELTGLGLGGALMDRCETWLREQDRAPVLEVLGVHSVAAALYRRRGWQVVDRVRPSWLPDHEDGVELMVLPA